jgi:hypothetical protein
MPLSVKTRMTATLFAAGLRPPGAVATALLYRIMTFRSSSPPCGPPAFGLSAKHALGSASYPLSAEVGGVVRLYDEDAAVALRRAS